MLRGGDCNSVITDQALSGATELVCASVGPIDVPSDSTRALVIAIVAAVPPASTSGLVLKIRRGTAASDTQVGQSGGGYGAGAAPASAALSVSELLTGYAVVSYCVTLVCTAGSGAGNVKDAAIAVLFF